MPDTHKEDSRGALIVTGSGRGIGAAVAKLAGERGFRVVVNYARNAQAAADVARAIVSSGGSADRHPSRYFARGRNRKAI